jgi:hypothetical protein
VVVPPVTGVGCGHRSVLRRTDKWNQFDRRRVMGHGQSSINMDDVKAAEKYRELRVRDVKCPTCGAFSGTRCRIAGGRSEISHQDRYLLAASYGIVPPLKGF